MVTIKPMAVLPTLDRAAVTADLMRHPDCPGGVNKTQLRAAVDAADQWADDNAGSFNSALPLVARNNLTTKQKAALLMFVIARRHAIEP